jgi:hypothetical protein
MEEFFVALENDPYKAHKEIIANGGYPALLDWVRGVAVDHGLCLTVLPTNDRAIQRWKDIARILGGKLCENNDMPRITREQLTKGLFEMMAHFRSAHKFRRNGETYIRGGCMVRQDKLTEQEKETFAKLVVRYNHEMKSRSREKGFKFISLADWMKETRVV